MMYIINKKNLKKKIDSKFTLCVSVWSKFTVLNVKSKCSVLRKRRKIRFHCEAHSSKKNPHSRKSQEKFSWFIVVSTKIWIGFFYAMKMCVLLKFEIAHCANWETNILNEWLYTPYHFTVNINLMKELERRRKPISRLSKHPDWLAHRGQSLFGVFWGLFKVFLKSF